MTGLRCFKKLALVIMVSVILTVSAYAEEIKLSTIISAGGSTRIITNNSNGSSSGILWIKLPIDVHQSGAVSVTFSVPFNTPPFIIITPLFMSQDAYPYAYGWYTNSISTAGFNLNFYTQNSKEVYFRPNGYMVGVWTDTSNYVWFPFAWIAIGN